MTAPASNPAFIQAGAAEHLVVLSQRRGLTLDGERKIDDLRFHFGRLRFQKQQDRPVILQELVEAMRGGGSILAPLAIDGDEFERVQREKARP